jgi:hypothetical protein
MSAASSHKIKCLPEISIWQRICIKYQRNSIEATPELELLVFVNNEDMKMKKLMLMLFASLFMAASAVHAQSVTVQANIPFDFVVGNSTMHAGTYTLRPISVGDSPILVRSADLTDHVLTDPCTCASDPVLQHENALVFKVIGDKYYLWQIWTAGYGAGRELSIRPRARDMEEANAAPMRTLVIKTVAKG